MTLDIRGRNRIELAVEVSLYAQRFNALHAGVPTETSPYPISRYFNPQSCVSVRRDHHHLMIPLYGRPPDHI